MIVTSLRALPAAIVVLVVGCNRAERAQPAPATAGTAPAAPSAGIVATPSSSSPGESQPRLELIELTTAGAHAQAELPMLVAVHGLGDRPESWVHAFDAVTTPMRVILPRAPLPWGRGSSWFEYPPKSEASLARGVSAAVDALARLLQALVRERPTRGKPIVTGFSQGGYLSFALATLHPRLPAAVFPVSGALPHDLWPADGPPAGAPPIVALHGAADTVVPISRDRAGVEHLAARGWKVELREYPGVEHTISPEMERELRARIEAAAR